MVLKKKELLIGLILIIAFIFFVRWIDFPQKLEDFKMKRFEKTMDRYHLAIEKSDISLCEDKEFPQDIKCFCKAIISKNIDYCKVLTSLKDSASKHSQCIEEVSNVLPLYPQDKKICDDLNIYPDKHYYYQCRAKIGKDLTECEQIILTSTDFKDRRGDYEVLIGDCFLETIDAIGDSNLCDQLKALEEKYGFSNFYSSTCFEKYGKPVPRET